MPSRRHNLANATVRKHLAAKLACIRALPLCVEDTGYVNLAAAKRITKLDVTTIRRFAQAMGYRTHTIRTMGKDKERPVEEHIPSVDKAFMLEDVRMAEIDMSYD